MNYDRCINRTDYGPRPYIANVEQMAMQNQNFRTAIWTGSCVQMTLMSIQPCEEIGWEMHPDTDQILRVEWGKANAEIGDCKYRPHLKRCLDKGDVLFVPAGTWHNVINTGDCPLKISSIYAPPNHPR